MGGESIQRLLSVSRPSPSLLRQNGRCLGVPKLAQLLALNTRRHLALCHALHNTRPKHNVLQLYFSSRLLFRTARGHGQWSKREQASSLQSGESESHAPVSGPQTALDPGPGSPGAVCVPYTHKCAHTGPQGLCVYGV